MTDESTAKTKAFIDGLIKKEKVFSIQVLDAVPEKIEHFRKREDLVQHFCPEDCTQVYVPGVGLICQDQVE